MKRLRSGYTTGACATAAARGAALMLRDQSLVAEVEINLPLGETARFTLHGQQFTPEAASCFVIKDAGDDPDITNGAAIHATVSFLPDSSPSLRPSPPLLFSPLPQGEGQGQGGVNQVIITGGAGIGRVTKPGLAVPPGEWAINPVPRRMITTEVLTVFPPHGARRTPHVTISIPDGELLARKTLNSRLGIVGGLSILGTTGIVRPVSAQAWTDTIDAAIDVALACGSEAVVLATGRTSELAAQQFLGRGTRDQGPEKPLTEEAFVMMGDHVGHALRSCARKGVKRVILAGQFAKLLKIACGHEQTHVSSSELDLQQLRNWLSSTPHTSRLTSHLSEAVTARGILEASGNDQNLIALVCERARIFAKSRAPVPELQVLLAGYAGEVLYFA